MTIKTQEATPVLIDVRKYCQYPTDCDSKRIAGIALYQAKLATPIPIGKRLYNVRLYNLIFLLGYIVLGTQVISTIGEPYRRFLEKADREGFQGTSFSSVVRKSNGTTLMFFSLIFPCLNVSDGGRNEAACRNRAFLS